MQTRQRILLLDDDQGFLDLYKEILSQLPSKPEIFTAVNGPRAMMLLETEPFVMLICDLKMPKMDGLQVLSVVRKKYPELRTVVLTAVMDEQFRSRAYALGVDLFWQKPSSQQEIKLFLDCLESLLGQEEAQTGFRGVQNKSLVDIIQLECISQNSTLLKVTRGQVSGKIWIESGEVIDAQAEALEGEAAFNRILSWKTGAFENLPAEPDHPKKIFKSYNALLLESAQAMDEARDQSRSESRPAGTDGASDPAHTSPIAALPLADEMEFIVTLRSGKAADFRGLEDPEPTASWTLGTLERFRALGDHLGAGPLEQVECLGPQRNAVLTTQGETEFCIGWKNTMSLPQLREATQNLLKLWGS